VWVRVPQQRLVQAQLVRRQRGQGQGQRRTLLKDIDDVG